MAQDEEKDPKHKPEDRAAARRREAEEAKAAEMAKAHEAQAADADEKREPAPKVAAEGPEGQQAMVRSGEEGVPSEAERARVRQESPAAMGPPVVGPPAEGQAPPDYGPIGTTADYTMGDPPGFRAVPSGPPATPQAAEGQPREAATPQYTVAGHCPMCHQPISVLTNGLDLGPAYRSAAAVVSSCSHIAVAYSPSGQV